MPVTNDKFAIPNAVGISPNERSDVFVLPQIVFQRVKPQKHIYCNTIFVWHGQAAQGAAIGDNLTHQLTTG